jgi:hypothetical protein
VPLSYPLNVTVEINLIITREGYVSLLEVIHTASQYSGFGKAGFPFTVIVASVYICNGHVVSLLNRSLDLKLICFTVYDETVTVQFVALSRQFFCYQWLN